MDKITRREKITFGLAGLGQNMVYNFATAYIMVFFTDVVKLTPIAVGTLLLVARFFDAVNDPIMGLFVDKRKSTKEKLLPFLRVIPIPMFISTMLLFLIPFESMTLRLIYAYASFILWDLVYTISDIPFWGLSVLMTSDPKERLSLLTYARVLSNVGLAVSIVIPPLLISSLGSNNRAYLLTGLLIAGIGVLLFSFIGQFGKERVQASENQESGKLFDLLKNKPLLFLQSSRFLSAFRMVLATSGLYYAKYNLGNEATFSIMGGILIASMILAMLVTPLLRKKYTKIALYNFSLVLGFLAHIALYILGDHMLITFIVLFVSGLSLGLGDVISYTLVGDSVEYQAKITGNRSEGIIFATHTFTTKLQSAFGLFTIGYILDRTGFIENTIQSASASQGIFNLISLLPAIACLLSLIPMFFFKLDDNIHL